MTTTTDFLNPTSATFDAEVLTSDTPVLVEFWAPWCGPCVAFKPLVEAVAGARSLTTAFVNVDENPELASRYDITSIPALKLFRGGELLATSVGALSKADLESWLESHGA